MRSGIFYRHIVALSGLYAVATCEPDSDLASAFGPHAATVAAHAAAPHGISGRVLDHGGALLRLGEVRGGERTAAACDGRYPGAVMALGGVDDATFAFVLVEQLRRVR